MDEQRAARRLLAKMDRCEDFAEKWENFGASYPDLPGWEAACQRDRFARTYWRLLGVMPTGRLELRRRLERIVDHGVGSVEQAIGEVNQRIQMNRSESLTVVSPSADGIEDPFA